jgi:endonuclease YncB( thermonuclease family)
MHPRLLTVGLAALGLGGLCLAAPVRAGETVSGHATASSGDIVTLDGRELRLFGIDAPEPGQTCRNRYGRDYDCFERSREILDLVVKDQTVDCEIKGTDAMRRTLAVCHAAGRDVGAVMVTAGWALAYRTLSGDYVAMEAAAQSRRRGLWSGQVEPPWLWRARTRPPAGAGGAASAPNAAGAAKR